MKTENKEKKIDVKDLAPIVKNIDANSLNIDKKEFASCCGIGKSALHHYSSSSWTETKMIIESVLKDRAFNEKLLKIVKVKLFIDEIKTWLANSENFFLPMKNKRIGLYKRYPINLFNLYGLENIQPNRKELSLFLPSEEDKKKSFEYSRAVQTKMSIFEEINALLEKKGIEPNRDKLIAEAKKAQAVIIKFNEEQKNRQSNLRKRLSDDATNNYYNRIDSIYLSKIADTIKNRIELIVDSININRILESGQKNTLLNYCLPENHIVK